MSYRGQPSEEGWRSVGEGELQGELGHITVPLVKNLLVCCVHHWLVLVQTLALVAKGETGRDGTRTGLLQA